MTTFNTQITLKVNTSEIYTQTQINNLLNDELNTCLCNTQIELKTNASDIYNQAQINNLLNDKLITSVFKTQIALKTHASLNVVTSTLLLSDVII